MAPLQCGSWCRRGLGPGRTAITDSQASSATDGRRAWKDEKLPAVAARPEAAPGMWQGSGREGSRAGAAHGGRRRALTTLDERAEETGQEAASTELRRVSAVAHAHMRVIHRV